MRAAAILVCVGAWTVFTLPAEAKTWTVKISGMRFDPPTVTVARGDTIEWVNADPFQHTVTSNDARRFDSHAIAPGAKWRGAQACRRTHGQHVGERGSEHELMDTSHEASPDDALMRTQIRALLERKLNALPEAFRVVFVLRCVEELSVEETAQCLGIPEATVRSRHFRARSLLRESMAQELDLAERDIFAFDGKRCDDIVAGVLARLDESVH